MVFLHVNRIWLLEHLPSWLGWRVNGFVRQTETLCWACEDNISQPLSSVLTINTLAKHTDILRPLSNCPVRPVFNVVLKWNARVLRTGSGQNGPAQGSEPLSSPAPVGQSEGIWRFVVEKNVCVYLQSTFQFKQARTSSFRPARTNAKQP